MQDGNYADVNRETGKRASIAELLKFATEYLKVDYIFWCREEPYYTDELLPFMRLAKLQVTQHGLIREPQKPGKAW